MRIETERLIITELTQNMATDVHLGSLDEDTRRFTPDEVFETPEDASNTVAQLISKYQHLSSPLVYAVLSKDGSYVGYVQAVLLKNGSWEIGYHIIKRYTGKGFATEAASAFIPFILNKLSMNELFGICLSANIASKKVLEKCGFSKQYEGEGDYHGGRYEICIYKYCTNPIQA